MPRRGQKHDQAARERISAGTRYGLTKRRKLEARVAELERLLVELSPADLRLLRETGALPAQKRVYADVAAASVLRLRRAVEGEPGSNSYRPLSEQRSALLEVAERVLLLAICEGARGLQVDDGESASRAGTLLGRFSTLIRDVLGLDAPEIEVSGLEELRRRRAEASQRANGAAGDAQGGRPAGRSAQGDQETEVVS